MFNKKSLTHSDPAGWAFGLKGAASLMLCLWVFAERGTLMAEAAGSWSFEQYARDNYNDEDPGGIMIEHAVGKEIAELSVKALF
jgi:hypothetical protein